MAQGEDAKEQVAVGVHGQEIHNWYFGGPQAT
jgi:hypothetical protein